MYVCMYIGSRSADRVVGQVQVGQGVVEPQTVAEGICTFQANHVPMQIQRPNTHIHTYTYIHTYTHIHTYSTYIHTVRTCVVIKILSQVIGLKCNYILLNYIMYYKFMNTSVTYIHTYIHTYIGVLPDGTCLLSQQPCDTFPSGDDVFLHAAEILVLAQ